MALYLFGIGGTGARVIKALTMLLASGAEIEHTDCVVPVIIDPDTSNGDLTRTVEILKHYQAIQRKARSTNGFFGTPLKSLNELGDGGGSEDQFRFDLEGVAGFKFGEFLGHNESMSRANRALTSLLYSEANLASDMQVGFKGNPHIGSVVLNKMRESELFRKFAAAVEPADRVFIISSIFGGTGAAGFPLLVKNIRGADSGIPNHARLQDMPVGAVTVMPYFSVEGTGTKTSINSDSFIAKTKAALSYYAKNLTGERTPRLNALYYIGDNLSNNMQAGADGGPQQANAAHFTELAAALAVLDFMKAEPEAVRARNGIALSPKYLEYGLKGVPSPIRFKNFAPKTHEIASHTLTEYYLFLKFFREHYAVQEHGRWAKDEGEKLRLKNLNATFRDHLIKFNAYYDEWLAEMESSQIAFEPFKRNASEKDILKIVHDYEENLEWYSTAPTGLKKFIASLNATAEKEAKGLDGHAKLFQLFQKTAKSLVAERIKL